MIRASPSGFWVFPPWSFRLAISRQFCEIVSAKTEIILPWSFGLTFRVKLQVDFAPTFLSLAGIEMPDYMDGTDLVPLLVAPAVARAQGEALPGSVTRSLSRSQVGGAVPKPKPVRETSFHQYFNQGPWKVNCTQAPKHRPRYRVQRSVGGEYRFICTCQSQLVLNLIIICADGVWEPAG
jgi:hypothetical protein